jgi:hypothetical protein
MSREVERRAIDVFADIWATHGMASIKQTPYHIQNYRTDLITTRLLFERQVQHDRAVVELGNGCCNQPGCPLNVFHRAILQTLEDLGRTPHCASCGSFSETLLTCGRCLATRYCSAGCQRTDWKRHKTGCTAERAAHTATYEPMRMRSCCRD